MRYADLIAKTDVAATVVAEGLAAYDTWRATRTETIDRGSVPKLIVETVTKRAMTLQRDASAAQVEVVRIAPGPTRPGGRRFGTLVHSVLASVPLHGDLAAIHGATALQGRVLGATEMEIAAAADRVSAALADPLFDRARAATMRSRCRREVPLAWRGDDGVLLEGVVDLAFEDDSAWVVVDFKTDEQLELKLHVYRRQLGLYAGALKEATGRPANGVLLHL